MDCLINDEIFGNDYEEDFQLPVIEPELWSNEIIKGLENNNQFFNDQDFDLNSFPLFFNDENKIKNQTDESSNIFQVSSDWSSQCQSPKWSYSNEAANLVPSLNLVSTFQQPMSLLDSRNPIDICHFLYEHSLDGPLKFKEEQLDKSVFNMTNVRNKVDDSRIFTKFKKSHEVPQTQEAHDINLWRERTNVEGIEYSLIPKSTNLECANDYNMSGNSMNQSLNSRSIPFLRKDNNFNNRFYETKYNFHKKDSYSTKLFHHTKLFQNPIPLSGKLILTEKEKLTLLAEGYQTPRKVPLTMHEERNLKTIRRKIKNKISAHESRRKKKEYMEALEKKVEIFVKKNYDLRKRLENQEHTNNSLLGQLNHLQHMLDRVSSSTASTCVMVFLICFSLILVGFPEHIQLTKLSQSLQVVGNIHKMGYRSKLQQEISKLTAIRKYFAPDIDAFMNTSSGTNKNMYNIKEIHKRLRENRGNEPFYSLESQISGQRKSILLGNLKEDEECVQHGSKYLWWFLQSPNFNAIETFLNTKTLFIENLDMLHLRENLQSPIFALIKPSMKNKSNLQHYKQN